MLSPCLPPFLRALLLSFDLLQSNRGAQCQQPRAGCYIYPLAASDRCGRMVKSEKGLDIKGTQSPKLDFQKPISSYLTIGKPNDISNNYYDFRSLSPPRYLQAVWDVGLQSCCWQIFDPRCRKSTLSGHLMRSVLLNIGKKQTTLRVLPQCGLIFCEMGICHEILVATNLCLEWDSPLYLELRHKFLEDETQDCSTQPSRTMHCSWMWVGVTRTAWKLAWYLPGFLRYKDCCSTCRNCWAANFWCLSEVLAVVTFTGSSFEFQSVLHLQ